MEVENTIVKAIEKTIDVLRVFQKNGSRQNPQNSSRLSARRKEKEGETQEKWNCVQKNMEKYGIQLEDAEDRRTRRTMIKGE